MSLGPFGYPERRSGYANAVHDTFQRLRSQRGGPRGVRASKREQSLSLARPPPRVGQNGLVYAGLHQYSLGRSVADREVREVREGMLFLVAEVPVEAPEGLTGLLQYARVAYADRLVR